MIGQQLAEQDDTICTQPTGLHLAVLLLSCGYLAPSVLDSQPLQISGTSQIPLHKLQHYFKEGAVVASANYFGTFFRLKDASEPRSCFNKLLSL